MEKKITNWYDIIVYINEEGNYDVDISANLDKSNNQQEFLIIKLNAILLQIQKNIFQNSNQIIKKMIIQN